MQRRQRHCQSGCGTGNSCLVLGSHSGRWYLRVSGAELRSSSAATPSQVLMLILRAHDHGDPSLQINTFVESLEELQLRVPDSRSKDAQPTN